MQRQFDDARAILNTLPDDPTAQQWLAKLDEIAPRGPTPAMQSSAQPPPAVASPQAGLGLTTSRLRYLVGGVVMVVAAVAVPNAPAGVAVQLTNL